MKQGFKKNSTKGESIAPYDDGGEAYVGEPADPKVSPIGSMDIRPL